MTEESRKPLPFEPDTTKKPKAEKPAAKKRPPVIMNKPPNSPSSRSNADNRIPEAVSKRMITRSVVCSGIPTFMGIGIFIGAYFLALNGMRLPNVVVLLVSMGCLGLGVMGLTYGILSASWEDADGSFWGLDEFKVNFDRMKAGYKANKELRKDMDFD
jgi:Photosynthesis affected mutant 68